MLGYSWSIDGLNAALLAQSVRGKQSYQVLQDLAKNKPAFIGIQETKLSMLLNK